MKREIGWAIGLFAITLAWAFLMNASLRNTGSTEFNIGATIGMGVPVFVATGVIAGIVFLISKKPTASMWAWTVLLLAVLAFLGIGGTYVTHAV